MTARRAATAGGIASALCVEEVRDGLPPFWPRVLTVCVEFAVREGIRGGMITGFECESIVAVDCAGFGSGYDIEGALVGICFSAGFTDRGESGFLAARVPIFAGLVRGDGGDCWRYG